MPRYRRSERLTYLANEQAFWRDRVSEDERNLAGARAKLAEVEREMVLLRAEGSQRRVSGG